MASAHNICDPSTVPEPLALQLDQLRAALGRALDAVEPQLGREVVLANDYYWHPPVDAAFDMTKEPTNFTVGQLSDDLADALAGGEADPPVSWHDLAHLIGWLRGLEMQALP